jgi:hypothetical protein
MTKVIGSAGAVVRLAPRFDVALLREEVQRVRLQFPQVAHPRNDHGGTWGGVSLIGPGGEVDYLFPGRTAFHSILSTPALDCTPYIRAIVRSLSAVPYSVRVMSLQRHGSVPEHTDQDMALAGGVVRLHLPVVTDESVVIRIADQSHHWAAGELWYADFRLPHRVDNPSGIDRVHIIADVAVTQELCSLFPPQYLADTMKHEDIPLAVDGVVSRPLRSYECAFLVRRLDAASSPYFELPPDPWLGETYLDGGSLWLRINRRFSSRVRPLDGDRFWIERFGPACRLCYNFKRGSVVGGTFTVKSVSYELFDVGTLR